MQSFQSGPFLYQHETYYNIGLLKKTKQFGSRQHPTLDPNGYATYSIADHGIHVPDDMIGTLPKTFEHRIREAAEAQAKADRLMSVFADPHGETARRMMRETAD